MIFRFTRLRLGFSWIFDEQTWLSTAREHFGLDGVDIFEAGRASGQGLRYNRERENETERKKKKKENSDAHKQDGKVAKVKQSKIDTIKNLNLPNQKPIRAIEIGFKKWVRNKSGTELRNKRQASNLIRQDGD